MVRKPRVASMTMGKRVASTTSAANTTNSTFPASTAPSRETGWSRLCGSRICGSRQVARPAPMTTSVVKKARNSGPIGPVPKA